MIADSILDKRIYLRQVKERMRMKCLAIWAGIMLVGGTWGSPVLAQEPRLPKTNKVVIVPALNTSFADSVGTRAHLNWMGPYQPCTFSAAWRNAQLNLLFELHPEPGKTYRLEAVVAPDLHFESRLSIRDAKGEITPIFPTDQLLVLNAKPGNTPRPLIGRISFRGVAAGTEFTPHAQQHVVRGNFQIKP